MCSSVILLKNSSFIIILNRKKNLWVFEKVENHKFQNQKNLQFQGFKKFQRTHGFYERTCKHQMV